MRWLIAILLLQATALSGAAHKNAVTTDDICMSTALHYEARGAGDKGLRAVYESIRYRASKRGLSICKALRQPYQYSWQNNGDKIKYDKERLTVLREVAMMKPLGIKADYFFSGKKKPHWAKQYKFVGEYGGNKFFRSDDVS